MVLEKANDTVLYASDMVEKFSNRYCFMFDFNFNFQGGCLKYMTLCMMNDTSSQLPWIYIWVKRHVNNKGLEEMGLVTYLGFNITSYLNNQMY